MAALHKWVLQRSASAPWTINTFYQLYLFLSNETVMKILACIQTCRSRVTLIREGSPDPLFTAAVPIAPFKPFLRNSGDTSDCCGLQQEEEMAEMAASMCEALRGTGDWTGEGSGKALLCGCCSTCTSWDPCICPIICWEFGGGKGWGPLSEA